MDKLTEISAYKQIVDLGINPDKVAWDWTEMKQKINEAAREEARDIMDRNNDQT